ncbi:MAG: hypothetical protein S4CHLAM6_02840 [Chlamydiae bacterium]|nr:hypothetical protein [Chlamydiota bacterium]
MKILITGSSGRFGSAIANFLSNKHKIIGIDLNPGAHTTHIIDISCNKNKLIDVSRNADAIIHTAALHAPHVKLFSKKKFWEVNVVGTEILLDICLKHKIPRFIFTSSTSIYGHALVHPNSTIWVTEKLHPQPRDIYDETKLAGEKLCEEAASDQLSCTSLRVSRCFPEPRNLMAIYRLYRGIDIRDVVYAYQLALASRVSGYEVFNISCQSPFKPSDLDNLYRNPGKVIEHYHPEAFDLFQKNGWLFPTTIDRVYAITKAQSQLGFKPLCNFLDFLKFENH